MNFIPDDLLKAGDVLWIYNGPGGFEQARLLSTCQDNRYALQYPDRSMRMPARYTDLIYEVYRDGCLVWLTIDAITIDQRQQGRAA